MDMEWNFIREGEAKKIHPLEVHNGQLVVLYEREDDERGIRAIVSDEEHYDEATGRLSFSPDEVIRRHGVVGFAEN